MGKKYEFTGETMEFEGSILHRIRALVSFGDVKKGDVGGWIETEDNLSHEGLAWVYCNAKVLDDAKVYDHAAVYGYVNVYGSAEVYDDARVYGSAKACGNSEFCGNVCVYGGVDV